jgi:hypothetical protein
LYFCHTWQGELGIYKFHGGDSKPINIFNKNMTGIGPNRVGIGCYGLYVNSIGDLFVFFSPTANVFKWGVNNNSGILVADGHKFDSTISRSGSVDVFAMDEINNLIYILDRVGPRILKYNHNSPIGTAIFDGSPKEIFSNVPPTHMSAWALIVDKTGYVLLGEIDKITMWTPDGKFHVTVLKDYHTTHDNAKIGIAVTQTMAFDRLGNLYVIDGKTNRVVKFNRTSIACKNNIS